MKCFTPILLCLITAACVNTRIRHIPCNELGQGICQEAGDRIFVINCSSSHWAMDATDVRNSCLKSIAKYVDKIGFEYFVVFGEKGGSYSQNYTYTTNQAITTYHDYNTNTNSTLDISGSGYLSGYSAYGYGNSNSRLSGTSTSYVPVQHNYTVTTKAQKIGFMPVYYGEWNDLKTGYFRVADYL